jgi:hypothetical protein
VRPGPTLAPAGRAAVRRDHEVARLTVGGGVNMTELCVAASRMRSAMRAHAPHPASARSVRAEVKSGTDLSGRLRPALAT